MADIANKILREQPFIRPNLWTLDLWTCIIMNILWWWYTLINKGSLILSHNYVNILIRILINFTEDWTFNFQKIVSTDFYFALFKWRVQFEIPYRLASLIKHTWKSYIGQHVLKITITMRREIQIIQTLWFLLYSISNINFTEILKKCNWTKLKSQYLTFFLYIYFNNSLVYAICSRFNMTAFISNMAVGKWCIMGTK